MIYHWMVTVLLFCKPSQAFFFFFARTEKCNPETCKNYVWLRVKLDLRPKFFLWTGYVKKFYQTKGAVCASCEEVQVYSKTHWFHWLWDTEKPHCWYPSPPTDRSHASIWWHVLCDASLAAAWSPCCSPSLQKRTPAGLVMVFFLAHQNHRADPQLH